MLNFGFNPISYATEYKLRMGFCEGGIHMKKVLRFSIILILIIAFGWFLKSTILINIENKELNSKIQDLQKVVASLQTDNAELREELKPKILTYMGYGYKYRFLENEIIMYQIPGEAYSEIGKLPPNTVVEVQDAVRINNDEIWLYITLPSSLQSEAINTKGWIKETETVLLTKSNQEKIVNGVIIKSRTPVYNMIDFESIKTSKPESLKEDVTGNIKDNRNNYIEVSIGAGWVLWVESKFISYPPIE